MLHDYCVGLREGHYRKPRYVVELRLTPQLVVEIPLCQECKTLLDSYYDTSSGVVGDPLARLVNLGSDEL